MLPVPLKAIEDMVAPLVVETTVIKAVVKAVNNNNNNNDDERGHLDSSAGEISRQPNDFSCRRVEVASFVVIAGRIASVYPQTARGRLRTWVPTCRSPFTLC